MRNAFVICGLGAALALSAAASAWCDPKVDYSVKGEFAQSEYVATVRVTRTTWLGEDRRPKSLQGKLMLGSIPGGFDPYAGAYYRVTVLNLFKGKPLHHLSIFSENTEARTPLRDGQRYLVFLFRVQQNDEDRKRGDLMIDYCGNSATLESAAPLLAQLKGLQFKGGNSKSH